MAFLNTQKRGEVGGLETSHKKLSSEIWGIYQITHVLPPTNKIQHRQKEGRIYQNTPCTSLPVGDLRRLF